MVFQKHMAARGPPRGMPPKIENFYLEESPPLAARQQQSGAAPLKDLYFSGDFCEDMRNEQKKRSRGSGTPHKQKYRSRPLPPVGRRQRRGAGETATRSGTSAASGARGGGGMASVRAARVSRAGHSEVRAAAQETNFYKLT